MKNLSLFKKTFNILSLFLLVFSIGLVITEYLTYTNFVINYFNFDYVDMFVISTLINMTNLVINFRFVVKHHKKIILFTPFYLTAGLLMIFMRKHQFFIYMEAEDSVIETIQVVFLVINTVISGLLANRFLKQKKKVLAIVFMIISFGFFVISAEEISWGQRIFNFQTPAEYAAINNQNELTLHNYEHVYGYVYKAYMLIGLFGASLWTIKKFLSKIAPKSFKELFLLAIPDWQYFFFFFTVFLYNLEVKILHPIPGDSLWEEPTELLLFLGLAIFLLELLKRKKNEK